ncbi:MAG: PAS domain S-box protein [Methanomassiliicoccales archaeon]|nr:PAS domain S-box protein [Methanomassiliicoccales archaeon]
MGNINLKEDGARYPIALIISWALVIIALGATSTYGYLLFHGLSEVLIVIFAASMFIVTWSVRRLLVNNYLLITGIGMLFIGSIEVLHLLTFKGMGVFPGLDSNVPTQLWLASRYLLVATLIAAPLVMGKRMNAPMILLGFLVATALILLSIMFGLFPAAYIEGSGLTRFKIDSEYLIAGLLVISAYLLYVKRKSFQTKTFQLLIGFILLNVGAELFFTEYIGVYDLANLVGHMFALTAFLVLFLAIVKECYSDPVKVLFNDLDESERKFRTIFDQAGDAIIIWQKDHRIIDANQMACRVLGYGREELLEKKMEDLLPPEKAEWISHGWAVLSTGPQEAKETVWVRKDRTQLAMDVSDQPIEYSGQEVILSIARDITERKRSEQALLESERRLAQALEVSMMGTWDLDLKRMTIWKSLRFDQIFGFAAQQPEWTIDTLLGHLLAEDRDKVNSQVKEAIEKKEELQLQTRILRLDNEVRWVNIRGRVVSDDAGEPAHLLGLIQDITQKIDAEKTLEKYAEDLKRSNAALEQFAYVASHDLREPLRMVVSYLGLLERKYKGRLDETANTYIGFAVDGGMRMQRMIDDFLTYSRVSNQSRATTPTSMEAVLARALLNLDALVRESKADITHDPLPEAMADETQMIQLFQNLIGNSIKYRGSELPVIHVSAILDGDSWRFSVNDNGIGIAPRYHEKVFEMFQRLDTNVRREGTGIGLAIAKKIVERHGGRIWVESEEGKGATFFFTLPALLDEGGMSRNSAIR